MINVFKKLMEMGTNMNWFSPIFSFIFLVLLIVAVWNIFEKAGVAGWKALIPIYNIYVSFQIACFEKSFWNLIVLSIAAFVLDILLLYFKSNVILAIVLTIIYIMIILYLLRYTYRLSKCFGHGIIFAIGLLIFPYIFGLILGLGKSKYHHLKEA